MFSIALRPHLTLSSPLRTCRSDPNANHNAMRMSYNLPITTVIGPEYKGSNRIFDE